MKRYWITRALKITLFVALAITLATVLVMSLWNWLMPAIFAWQPISFWQALGLLVLSRILFGGLRGRPGFVHWRRRMAERWEQMTPEERERFREGMRGRCGHFGKSPAEQ